MIHIPTTFVKDRSGVTLAEMMVAFGVFGIFISIAMGGFMQSLRNQRVALVLMEANDAGSIIFENIARQLRTASPSGITGGSCIGFTPHEGTQELPHVNYCPTDTVISTAIKVASFNADVISSLTQGAPPRVMMTITMEISDASISSGPIRKTLQTTISPRIYYNLNSITPHRQNNTSLPAWF